MSCNDGPAWAHTGTCGAYILLGASVAAGTSVDIRQVIRGGCPFSTYRWSFWYKLTEGCDLEYWAGGAKGQVLPGPEGPGQWQFWQQTVLSGQESAPPSQTAWQLRIGALKKGSAACGVSIDDIKFYRAGTNPNPTRRDMAAANLRLSQ